MAPGARRSHVHGILGAGPGALVCGAPSSSPSAGSKDELQGPTDVTQPGPGKGCGTTDLAICRPGLDLGPVTPGLTVAGPGSLLSTGSLSAPFQTGKQRPRERQQLLWATQNEQRQSESRGRQPQTTLLLWETQLWAWPPAGPQGTGNAPEASRLGPSILDLPTASSEGTVSHLVCVAALRGWCGRARGAWGCSGHSSFLQSAQALGIGRGGVGRPQWPQGGFHVDGPASVLTRSVTKHWSKGCPGGISDTTKLKLADSGWRG